MNPRPLLHLEGVAVLTFSLWAYHAGHGSWMLFALLFLTPDLSMFGYLVNVRWGAIAYNAVHTYVGPALLAGIALAKGYPTGSLVAWIWAAHIGFDRMLGYGLKYPTRFNDTHLNPDRHTADLGTGAYGTLQQVDQRAQSKRRRHEG